MNGRRIREREVMIREIEEYWKVIGGVNEPARDLGNITLGRKIEE